MLESNHTLFRGSAMPALDPAIVFLRPAATVHQVLDHDVPIRFGKVCLLAQSSLPDIPHAVIQAEVIVFRDQLFSVFPRP